MCLTLHPARCVEGPVACLNRESELTDLPPAQFLPCGSSSARRSARRASES
jgi:hypothetical protein